MIDPLNALAFSLFENRGVYALLLGSGLSRAASIPTGWEITLDLTRRLAELEGAKDNADWSAWYQERFGEPPSSTPTSSLRRRTSRRSGGRRPPPTMRSPAWSATASSA
jgi:hypothetical protein